MSKILVIPDMHLKPTMLDATERILTYEKIDKIIILGDILDDFFAEPETYELFWQRFTNFYMSHKNQTVLLFGNHEVGYLIGHRVTGHTEWGAQYARAYADLSPKIVHAEDKIVFSHGGVFDEFLRSRDISDLPIHEAQAKINAMPLRNLWSDVSPLWARPQHNSLHVSGGWLDYFQVVGHTPMRKIKQSGNIISTDVFSTNWGEKYGEEKMIVIDSSTANFKIFTT